MTAFSEPDRQLSDSFTNNYQYCNTNLIECIDNLQNHFSVAQRGISSKQFSWVNFLVSLGEVVFEKQSFSLKVNQNKFNMYCLSAWEKYQNLLSRMPTLHSLLTNLRTQDRFSCIYEVSLKHWLVARPAFNLSPETGDIIISLGRNDSTPSKRAQCTDSTEFYILENTRYHLNKINYFISYMG